MADIIKKEPLIRIAKRAERSNKQKLIIRLLSVLLAICAGGVGFTAIIVAWLANLNPFGILVVSFLFAVLEKGSTVVSSEFVLSPYCSDVLQGIILFFVLGCEFFIRYRFVTRGGRKND